jgi:hypothetical protein
MWKIWLAKNHGWMKTLYENFTSKLWMKNLPLG